ncbi:MAG: hypothetical protein P4L92_16195, partial [Rudaea sp.]|nr:hypothetical protein [Rudaea sp.]
NTYTLTYTAGANGSITGTTPQTVNSGGNGTAVTAVPNAGYHFVQWSDASTANPRTDTNVTANISVTASFAQDQLVFTTQPANVTRGGALGVVVVTEQDGSGNTIIDNSSSVDFTIAACGGSVDLGSVTMIDGVATLNSTQLFYTLTSTPGLQINASTGTLNGTSQAFNVVANSDFVFASGFEACRL